ncbi:MAG TPA: response regulator [Candidatus Wirthbacteria bacterium]|nr:response regulator [Candidatus Wirthbacteria bacterium]
MTKKILVAEDELPLKLALTTKLESAGFDVVSAANGQEAIDQAIRELPDLIFLDVMMPIKDGFEALEEIKAEPKTKNIPIVFLTNYGHGYMKENAQSGGAADYSVKTDVSLNEIVSKAKKILAIS